MSFLKRQATGSMHQCNVQPRSGCLRTCFLPRYRKNKATLQVDGHDWLFVLTIKSSKQSKANKNLYINEQPAKVGNKMKRKVLYLACGFNYCRFLLLLPTLLSNYCRFLLLFPTILSGDVGSISKTSLFSLKKNDYNSTISSIVQFGSSCSIVVVLQKQYSSGCSSSHALDTCMFHIYLTR